MSDEHTVRVQFVTGEADSSSLEATPADIPAVVINPLGPTGPQPEVDEWIASTDREERRRQNKARIAAGLIPLTYGIDIED